MKWNVTLSTESTKTKKLIGKQMETNVREASELWLTEKKEEAAKMLVDIFQDGNVPSAELFTPYIKELGTEYCSLIQKMYLLHMEENNDMFSWELSEFLEECPGECLLNTVASKFVGDQWSKVQRKFYDKCPECMFLGGADQTCSLKLRSASIVECIPEGLELNDLSGMEYMDGYNQFEGYALVKDDPKAKTKYPAEIQTILSKIEKRGRKYYPNLIFPLTEGNDILDTCAQMMELLELLEYGYHFESISEYISSHPKLFPDIMKERLEILRSIK